eukprot:359985-Chlamydomonas_euryale.AAC.15
MQGLNSNADSLPPPEQPKRSWQAVRDTLVTASSGGMNGKKRGLLHARQLSQTEAVPVTTHLTTLRSSLVLKDLPNLTDISSLRWLQEVSWSVTIERCDSLTSINSLAMLRTIGGELLLAKNEQLVGCGGMSNLQSVGRFEDADSLLKTGLQARCSWLHSGAFNCTGHKLFWQSLQSCSHMLAGACTSLEWDKASTFDRCSIMTNMSALATHVRMTVGPGEHSAGSNIALMWNAAMSDVDCLRLVSYVEGDLVISGNRQISDLGPLAGLTDVKLNIVLSDMPALGSLNGLSALSQPLLYVNTCVNTSTRVGAHPPQPQVGYHLVIARNAQLQSLSGLSSLASVGSDVYVRGNAQLASLDGLTQGIGSVGGSLYVEENPQLVLVGGLTSWLQPSGRVAGPVHALANARLPQDQQNALKALSGASL